jgi:hypothetical protein
MGLRIHLKGRFRNSSPILSIIFEGSGEIFYVFSIGFSDKHRQETSGKKTWKISRDPGI